MSGKAQNRILKAVFSLFSLNSRPAGRKPCDSRILSGRRDLRRNRSPPVPLSDGGRGHRIRHRHHQADQRNKLGQVTDGEAGAATLLGEAAGGTGQAGLGPRAEYLRGNRGLRKREEEVD